MIAHTRQGPQVHLDEARLVESAERLGEDKPTQRDRRASDARVRVEARLRGVGGLGHNKHVSLVRIDCQQSTLNRPDTVPTAEGLGTPVTVNGDALKHLDRTTLRERALLVLRAAITSGQYRAGDHLGEVELASQLGVSRGTVREALRHLQQEGLVRAGARGKLRVATLSAAQVRELYRVRAALEGLAATELIASPNREEALAALDEAVTAMDSVEGDFAAQIEADLAFHLLLCELSRNSVLIDTWRHLEGPIRVTLMSAGRAQVLHNMAAGRHSPIVAALQQGDTAGAVAMLHEHMISAGERLARALEDR